jgi:hypothetical protein
MKKEIIGMFIILILLVMGVTGCEKSCSEKEILVNDECCIDSNNNGICDNIEISQQQNASSQQSQPSQASISKDAGYLKTDPAPAGIPLNFSIKSGSIITTNAEITLLEFKRGEDAWTMLQAADSSTPQPSLSNLEYVAAKMRFKLVSYSEQTAYIPSPYIFGTVSNSNVYKIPFITATSLSIEKELHPGQTAEGWIAVVVEKSDTKPVLRVQASYIAKELWFKLY